MRSLKNYHGIWYNAMKDEIDLASLDVVRTNDLKPWIIIPLSKTLDPFAYADTLIEQAAREKKENIYLFIPGQRFDANGTRHGRGYGWYDRLLSRLPKHWLRIGISRHDQWSDVPLKREPWDELMDWVIHVAPNNTSATTTIAAPLGTFK